MVTTSSGRELIRERRVGLPWLPFVNQAVVLRSAIVAVVIGSVLTLLNQPAWVAGDEPLQFLPLILVFVTPFVVVAISQVVAARRAFSDAIRHGAPASPRGFIATTISHGIPARALAIGLIIGSVNAILSVAGALLFWAISRKCLSFPWVKPLRFRCCLESCPKPFPTGVQKTCFGKLSQLT